MAQLVNKVYKHAYNCIKTFPLLKTRHISQDNIYILTYSIKVKTWLSPLYLDMHQSYDRHMFDYSEICATTHLLVRLHLRDQWMKWISLMSIVSHKKLCIQSSRVQWHTFISLEMKAKASVVWRVYLLCLFHLILIQIVVWVFTIRLTIGSFHLKCVQRLKCCLDRKVYVSCIFLNIGSNSCWNILDCFAKFLWCPIQLTVRLIFLIFFFSLQKVIHRHHFQINMNI